MTFLKRSFQRPANDVRWSFGVGALAWGLPLTSVRGDMRPRRRILHAGNILCDQRRPVVDRREGRLEADGLQLLLNLGAAENLGQSPGEARLRLRRQAAGADDRNPGSQIEAGIA